MKLQQSGKSHWIILLKLYWKVVFSGNDDNIVHFAKATLTQDKQWREGRFMDPLGWGHSVLSRGEKVREFGLWLYRDTESLHKTTKAIQYMLRWPPPSQSCYSQFIKEDVFNFLNSDKENLAISYKRNPLFHSCSQFFSRDLFLTFAKFE